MLKTCLQVTVCLAMLCAPTVHAAHYDGERIQRELLISMLLGESPAEARLASRAIAQMYKNDVELLDCVAEQLYKGASTDPSSKGLAAPGWYADAIKRSANNRYVDVLSKSRERYTEPKIVKVLDEALVTLGPVSVPQYVPGSVDLPIKRAASERYLASVRESRHARFASIRPESSLQELFAELGAPDAMTSTTARVQKWVRMNVLMVNYLGAGVAIVRMDTSGSPHWVVTELVDELIPVQENYSGPNVGLAQISVALRGAAFLQFMKTEGRLKNDKQATYLMAKRLIAFPRPMDKLEDAGMSVAMKRIANTRETEMIDVLRKLADTPGKSKAKKTAKTLVLKFERKAAAGKSEKADDAEEEDDDADDDAETKDAEKTEQQGSGVENSDDSL